MSQRSQHPTVRGLVAVVAVLSLTAATSSDEPSSTTQPGTSAPDVRIRGGGSGHGVGMSQYGAYAQALEGWSAAKILRYWYPGVRLGERRGMASRPITVNLTASARRAGISVERGAARWMLCTPGCAWLEDGSGSRVIQRPGDGTWSVRRTRGGAFRLMHGSTQVWRGGDHAATLRVRLSTNEDERTIVRAAGGRYRWGHLEFSSASDADCRAPRLCVNVNVPSVERYLYGLAEVPSSWAAAALKAQVIAGRTYALRNISRLRRGCRCHVVAAPADQAYAGYAKEEGRFGARWVKMVRQTRGRVVLHDSTLASTFYSSSHNGRSENVEDSFAFSAPLSSLPYLASVNDRWSDDEAVNNPNASWTETIPNKRFAAFVDDDLERVTRVEILSRTEGGTPKELEIRGIDRSGERVVTRFAGTRAKRVGERVLRIAGSDLRREFGLPSQQIDRITLAR